MPRIHHWPVSFATLDSYKQPERPLGVGPAFWSYRLNERIGNGAPAVEVK
jgi:hypothetical protein